MIITLLISILPVYLVGLYIYKKDRNKEPKSLLKKLFIYGMLSCIPAGIIELLLGNLFGPEETMNMIKLFLYVLITIALIEELFKWIIVYALTYNKQEFDEVYDAIIYAVFASLGFACFENIFYVLSTDVSVGLFRAITAIPAHASDAIIMGNYLGLAKIASINKNKKLYKKNLILSITMPTIVHTIYDYCLFTKNTIFLLIFVIFIISIYGYSIRKIKFLSTHNKQLNNEPIIINKQIYCPNCGKLGNDNYCTKCGTKL